jgi:L-asparaginase
MDGLLIIYTGGTIGMAGQKMLYTRRGLTPMSWEQLRQNIPQLDQLGLEIHAQSIANPIDSSHMSLSGWQEIGRIIAEQCDRYAGFVVLHGTDTMSYTATALAFMLRGLDRPVVLTGAQIPLAEPRTDGTQNLTNALTLAAGPAAGLPVIPEVCILFHDKLLRGCRATKVSTHSFDAFASPNYPALADVGATIDVRRELVRPVGERLHLHDHLAGGVITMRFSPGLDASVLDAILSQPVVRGLVLETYGTGNIPHDPRTLDVLERAIARGMHVVCVSQCLHGHVELGLYEASEQLLQRGVISGIDMTTEAALVKLKVLIAEHGDDAQAVRQLMEVDHVGEQSWNLCTASFPAGSLRGGFTSPSAKITGSWTPDAVRNALLELHGVRLAGETEETPIVVRIASGDGPITPETPVAGLAIPDHARDQMLHVDISRAVRGGLIEPGQPVRFSLAGPDIDWTGAMISIASRSSRCQG